MVKVLNQFLLLISHVLELNKTSCLAVETFLGWHIAVVTKKLE